MARLRTNFVGGTIAVDLTNVSTTLNSSGLSLLPAVGTPDVAVIVLDPDALSGAPEIVYVTAHTAGNSIATILRGQEGTAARAHLTSNGIKWRHGATKNDWDLVKEGIINVKEFGAIGDGVTDDTTAIQNAINASLAGRPCLILLSTGNDPSNYRITQTLTITRSMVTFGSFAGHGSPGNSARLTWDGAVGGTMMSISGENIHLRGFCFAGNSKANIWLTMAHADSYVIEDVQMSNNINVAGWIIGDGIANMNNFTARNVRVAYGDGAAGIAINAPATENLQFYNCQVTCPNNGTASTGLITITGGNCDFFGLILDDNNYTGYAVVATSGATTRFFNLVSEMKQTLQIQSAEHSRGSGIWGADIRSCDAQAGQYCIDIEGAANNFAQESFVMAGVRLNRLSGSTTLPSAHVNNAMIVGNGVWWTDSTDDKDNTTASMAALGTTVTVTTANFFTQDAFGNAVDQTGWKVKLTGAGWTATDLETTIASVTDGTHAVLTDPAGTAVTNARIKIGRWGGWSTTSASRVLDMSQHGVSRGELVFSGDDQKWGLKFRINGKNVIGMSVTSAGTFLIGQGQGSGLVNGQMSIDSSGLWKWVIGNTETLRLDDTSTNNTSNAQLRTTDNVGSSSLKRVNVAPTAGVVPAGAKVLYVT